jgi:hypothetical protein
MVDKSLWVRVFKIPYKKQGDTLIRQMNIACETVKSGLYKPGTKTFIDTTNLVTVHFFTDYFEEPKNEEAQDKVDALAERVEIEADEYVRKNYPNHTLSAELPE